MKVAYMFQGMDVPGVIEDVMDILYEDKYVQVRYKRDGNCNKTIFPYQGLLFLTTTYDNNKEDEK